MEHKNITIKFTVPKLTKDKVHTVVIQDTGLHDTWTSVCLDVGVRDGNFTHDLNAWADSLGNMDMLRVSVYPFIHNADGSIDTDYDNPIRCRVQEVSGDPDLVAFKGVNRWGYRKNVQMSFV